jgi:hypothetical protein
LRARPLSVSVRVPWVRAVIATAGRGLRRSSLGRDTVWIMADPQKKVTVALDAEIVARTRDVFGDADLPDAAVIERALNAYLLGRLLDATQATSDLAAEQADQLAVDEVRAYRRERGLVE